MKEHARTPKTAEMWKAHGGSQYVSADKDRSTRTETEDLESKLEERYFGFPEGMTYLGYMRLPEMLREHIAKTNRIIQTDTYNRTMEHIYGDEWDTPSTYTLQLRRSPHGYIIAAGMKRIIEEFAKLPITQSELDFAEEFYQEHASVPYFNKEKWQMIIDEHGGYLPIQIDSVPEGTPLLPGDPVMRVTGPSEIVAHFEPYLHRVFYASMVATTAFEISKEFEGRFIEVGKRGTPNEDVHMTAARAMLLGGNIQYTSNDAAAVVYEALKDVGTLGHRYVQSISIQDGMTERDAFEKAIQETDSVSLLIDLVDSYQGIDTAVGLKEQYRESGKKIWIRLDSGDIADQAVYTLQKYAEKGYLDPTMDKVIVEGISSVDDMRMIDAMVRDAGFDPEKHVLYGAGGLLVAATTTRSDASSGFKLARWGKYDSMKFSDSPGKENVPGNPTVYENDGNRIIGQVGEELGNDLFVPAYRPGTILLPDYHEEMYTRAKEMYKHIEDQVAENAKTPHSQRTKEIEDNIRDHYGV